MNFAKLSSKIILFFLTLLFWSLSACLGYVGFNILVTYEAYFDIVSYLQSVLPAFIIIGVSILMLLIGIIGVCGIFSENRCLLGTFFFLLATLLSLEISSVVLVFLYRDNVNKYIKNLFEEVLESYGKRETLSLTQNFDYLQHKLHCCGQYNYTDWQNSWWFKNDNDRMDSMVPQSCCVGYTINLELSQLETSLIRRRMGASAIVAPSYCTAKAPQPIPLDDYYVSGCFTKLKHLIREQFLYISGIILALMVIQFTGLISICILVLCKKKQSKQQPPYININTHEDINYNL